MLGEDQVPPAQRFLMVEGLLSPSSLDKARPGLPASWPASARCLDFPDGVPAIIEQIPVADTWYEHTWSVGLCRRENLSAIQQ